MNTWYFVVKEEKAILLLKYPTLYKLQQKHWLDLVSNSFSDCACVRLASSAANGMKNELKAYIEIARFISLLSDGSTNKEVLEEKIVYIHSLSAQ